MTRLSAAFLTAPPARAVMAALGDGYFVGGCVRNALLGAPVSDIDIATPLLPEVVDHRLRAAGLKSIPTGIDHGTITAGVDGQGIEVTTFRADVATDGRRAVVAFTTDMAIDAGRRDFTMNALYARADGQVIDPLGTGLSDLSARIVRFIGRPEGRIAEDYLRILRFFRFFAWYGGEGIDRDGLAACAALVDGLEGLARERVGWEFRKLLGAPDPAPALASMAAAGVLARCLPGADGSKLAPLVHLEGGLGRGPDWLVRLAARGGNAAPERLRLSRAESTCLQRITAAMAEDSDAAAAYRYGPDIAQAAALVRAASLGTALPSDLQASIGTGAAAVFPLSASDLIEAGMPPGPALGRALAAAEQDWIDSAFSLDKAALLGLSEER